MIEKIKMRLVLTFILIYLLLLSTVNSGAIIPDPVNPLLIRWSNVNQFDTMPTNNSSFKRNSVIINFTLPATSAGLAFGNYIGISFPLRIGPSELLFDKTETINGVLTPRFSCLLTDGTINYNMTPAASASNPIIKTLPVETNIAYCKFNDKVNDRLAVNKSYRITIVLNSLVKLTSLYWDDVGIFTSTSNNPGKIIIDSNTMVGSCGMYKDVIKDTSTIRPLVITKSQIFVTKGPSAAIEGLTDPPIYPFNTFKITLNFKANTFISKDNSIVLRYPSDTVTAPTSTRNFDMNNKSSNVTEPMLSLLTNAPDTGYTIEKYSDDSFGLKGIGENLLPNREFQFSFDGWTALDTGISTSLKDLEVWLYYKNTYTPISYVKVSIIRISKGVFNKFSIAHPENWDIYMGGAWPLTFKFNIASGLEKGGYVAVQHLGYSETSSQWNFIASSCDFSQFNTVLYSNQYGFRQVCHPLRNDLTFDAFTGGSGIFFYLQSVIGGEDYIFSVWGVADVCGSTTDPTANNTTNNESFKFGLIIYKYADNTKFNENRLSSPIAATSGDYYSASKCWRTVTGTSLGFGIFDDLTLFYKKATTQVPTVPGAGTGDSLMYKEIYDPIFYNQISKTGTTSDWGTDITAANATPAAGVLTTPASTFQPSFPYALSTATLVQGFFIIRGDFYIGHGTETMYIRHALPSAIWWSSATYKPMQGRLSVLFTKNYFSTGDNLLSPFCYLSWAIAQPNEKNVNSPLNGISGDPPLHKTLLITTPSYNPADNPQTINHIGTNSSFSTIDTTPTTWSQSNGNWSNQDSSKGIVRITSIFDIGYSGGSRFQFSADAAKDNVNCASTKICHLSFGLFSSCIKWVIPEKVKSLYTYIDVQAQWLWMDTITSNDAKVVRNIRFISLFPEIGGSNDYSKNFKNTTGKNYYLHYAYQSYNSGKDFGTTNNAACLVEVNYQSMNSAFTAGSSTAFAIWLYGFNLLDSDYTSLNSEYPVVSMSAEAKAYGFNSGYGFSSNGVLSKTTNSVLQKIAQNTYNSAGDLISINQSGYSQIKGINGVIRSSYYFYMSSMILITKVTSWVQATNLLVPVICPYITGAGGIGYNVPSIASAWINMTSYIDITKVDKFMIDDTNSAIYSPTPKTSITTAANFYISTLRFTSYMNMATGQDNILYTINGILNGGTAGGSATNCSGAIFFFANGFASVPTGNYKVGGTAGLNLISKSFYNTYSYFYMSGKPFSGAYLGGSGATNSANIPSDQANKTTQMSVTATTSFLTGINRPKIGTTWQITDPKTGMIKSTDQIAFFCVGNQTTDLNVFSNFIYSATNTSTAPTMFNYILDFTSDNTFLSTNILMGMDKVGDGPYRDDRGGNLMAKFTFAGGMPVNSILRVRSLESFSTDTICGLDMDNGYVNECTGTQSDARGIDCVVHIPGTIFKICCYNVFMKDIVMFDSVKGILPNDPAYPELSKYVMSDIYNPLLLPVNYFTWTTLNQSNISLVDSQYAKIVETTYSLSQDSSFTKVTFKINLQRQIPRDTKIQINGDFSPMTINGIIPRCVATTKLNLDNLFGAWDTGDVIIDTCSAQNINLNSKSIVIITKRLVYKCGLTLSNYIYVSLWPVVAVNYGNLPYSISPFTIDVLTSSNGALLNSDQIFNIPATTTSFLKPPTVTSIQYDTLCSVNSSSIIPRLPDEKADYIFNIDLDVNQELLKGLSLNHITIFFPIEYYGAYLNSKSVENITCKYKDKNVVCAFEEEGILNININNKLAIGSGVKIPVKILGVINPRINGNYSFACTVNNINSLGVKSQLVTGTGLLTDGLFYNVESNKIGNLLLYNDNFISSSYSPRSISQLTFRVGFDTALDMIQLPLTINNNPILIITFPEEFNLAWYPGIVPTSVIYEYTYNSSNQDVRDNTIFPDSTTVSGNRIIIKFYNTSYLFVKNFRYWDIILTNIVNPSMILNYSSAFKILLTNSDYSWIFRTWTNINTHAKSKLATENIIDPFISYARGLTYMDKSTRFNLDVVKEGEVDNNVTVNMGRYSTYYFKVNFNFEVYLSKIAETMIYISDLDTIFKFGGKGTYTISAANEKIPFLIGAPCNSPGGKYIAYINTLNTNDFDPMVPLKVLATSKIKALITFQTPTNSILGGDVPVYYTFSEPNFDILSVSWKPGVGALNDIVSYIDTIIVQPETTNTKTFFRIENPAVTNMQLFEAIDPNACYTFPVKTVSIYLNVPTIKIPANTYLSKDLTYVPNWSGARKDSIQFRFTSSTYAPIFIYCTLICNNMKIPTESEIKQQTLVETPLVKNFFGYLFQKGNSIDIIYTGLGRGNDFNLYCEIESTEDIANNDKNRMPVSRTTAKANITSLKIGNYTTYVTPTTPFVNFTKSDFIFKPDLLKNESLSTSKTALTQCLKFTFAKVVPDNVLKTTLVNYCQYFFSSKNNVNKGCVVCTDLKDDSYTYVPTGLEVSSTARCKAPFYLAPQFIKNNSTNSTNSTSKTGFNDTIPVRIRRLYDEDNINNNNDLNRIDTNLKGFNNMNDLIDNKYKINTTKITNIAKQSSNSKQSKQFNPPNNIASTNRLIAQKRNTQAINYYYYTFCMVPHMTCQTDPQDDKGANFDTLVANLKTNLANSDAVENFIKIPKVPVANVEIIKDSNTPIATNIISSNKISKLSGEFYVTLSYTNDLRCYWELNANPQPSYIDTIINCNNTQRCGNSIITSEGTTIYRNGTSIIPFEGGLLYKIWTVCYNMVVQAQNPSETFIAYSFDFPYIAPNITDNSTNVVDALKNFDIGKLLDCAAAAAGDAGSQGCSIPGSYLKIDIKMILMLLILIIVILYE